MTNVRVELWWQIEQAAGRLWDRRSRDGVTAGRFLDWLTAYAYRRRKQAERRTTA